MLESEITEPIISALCQPKESCFVLFLFAILSARIEIAKPMRSDARWAESVKIAIEPA
jgi:hypothetical protein